MKDKELLELAARATGIEIIWNVMINRTHPILAPRTQQEKMWLSHEHQAWSPLDDDGDAFRLMAALGLDIEWRADGRVAVYRHANADGHCFTAFESSREDTAANVRRAIVRAAAAIAQEMTDAQG